MHSTHGSNIMLDTGLHFTSSWQPFDIAFGLKRTTFEKAKSDAFQLAGLVWSACLKSKCCNKERPVWHWSVKRDDSSNHCSNSICHCVLNTCTTPPSPSTLEQAWEARRRHPSSKRSFADWPVGTFQRKVVVKANHYNHPRQNWQRKTYMMKRNESQLANQHRSRSDYHRRSAD